MTLGVGLLTCTINRITSRDDNKNRHNQDSLDTVVSFDWKQQIKLFEFCNITEKKININATQSEMTQK